MSVPVFSSDSSDGEPTKKFVNLIGPRIGLTYITISREEFTTNVNKLFSGTSFFPLISQIGLSIEQRFLLGTKNQLIGYSVVSRGLLDRCHCHSRVVFRQAIAQNAAKIVLLHNHPSGDVKPSQADLSVTKALRRAGRIIDIEIVDHIIVGQEQEFKFYSMRTEKDLN